MIRNPDSSTIITYLDFAAQDMEREALALEAGWPTHPEHALDALGRLYARHGTENGSDPLTADQLDLLDAMASWDWQSMGAERSQ